MPGVDRGHILLLVGDDADGPAADARVAAQHRLAVLGAVFLEAAPVHDARDDFAHVVLLRRIGRENAVNLLGRIRGRLGWLAVEGRARAVAHFVDERANPREAGLVVGLAKIDRAADLRVHLRAAQFFGRHFLADGGLHQRGPREKKPAAFGHQDVIAHDRQIRAARDAHSHDRRDLRNAHRAHHRVIAKHAAEIVRVGKNVFLQRQENARRNPRDRS